MAGKFGLFCEDKLSMAERELAHQFKINQNLTEQIQLTNDLLKEKKNAANKDITRLSILNENCALENVKQREMFREIISDQGKNISSLQENINLIWINFTNCKNNITLLEKKVTLKDSDLNLLESDNGDVIQEREKLKLTNRRLRRKIKKLESQLETCSEYFSN